MVSKYSCVFCATPEIATKALEELHNNPLIDLKLVISMPDRPAGRGKRLKSPEIVTRAKELGIEVLQTENINKSEDFKNWCDKNPIDLMVVFAFAQFLGEKTLSIPRLGCFNIHTSLLPKYRGAAPMQYSLFNGDKTTGLSIQKMVKKMDAGNIVECLEIKIDNTDNLGTLHDKFKDLAPEVLNSFINKLNNNELVEKVQDESKVSFAPSIPKNETLLDFESQDAVTLHNKVRGLSPIPCAYLYLNNKRAKVYESELSNVELKTGETCTKFNTILIGTTKGTLRLKSIQIEGKSRLSDVQVINGFKSNNTEINITNKKV